MKPKITDYTYYQSAESPEVIYAEHKESKRIWALWEGGGWYKYTGWRTVGTYLPLSPLSALLKVGFCPRSAKDIECHTKHINDQIKVAEKRIKELEYASKQEETGMQAEIWSWQTRLFELQIERNKLEKQLAKINKHNDRCE